MGRASPEAAPTGTDVVDVGVVADVARVVRVRARARAASRTGGTPGQPRARSDSQRDNQTDGDRGRNDRNRSGKGQPGGRETGSKSGGQQGRRRNAPTPVEAVLVDGGPIELDEQSLIERRGRSRKGRAIGRYQMNVHVGPDATHIAILEGRALVEHYVSHPADDVFQIHGNIYVGRVENVLPGMEAAFVDIGTPKNAVLYQSDVQYDPDDVESKGTHAEDRGRPQAPPAHRLPGHQEPHRPQGRPPDPGGVAPRSLRGAGAQLADLRDLEATAATTNASGSARSSIG